MTDPTLPRGGIKTLRSPLVTLVLPFRLDLGGNKHGLLPNIGGQNPTGGFRCRREDP